MNRRGWQLSPELWKLPYLEAKWGALCGVSWRGPRWQSACQSCLKFHPKLGMFYTFDPNKNARGAGSIINHECHFMSLSASPFKVVVERRWRACLALELAEKLDLELFMTGSKQRPHQQAAASFKFKTLLADPCVQEASCGSWNYGHTQIIVLRLHLCRVIKIISMLGFGEAVKELGLDFQVSLIQLLEIAGHHIC